MCSNADAHLKGEKVMVKKLRCTVIREDYVKVGGNGYGDVRLNVKVDGNKHDIFLSPSDAKKLRKQIKKALAEINGEDEQENKPDESAYIPHAGEVVEVFQNTVDHAFQIGQKVRVVEVEGESVKAQSLNGITHWWVGGDIKPIQNWKPKEGEKVLIVDSTLATCGGSRSFVGKFGIVGAIGGDVLQVYNEDKSDWFGFHISDLRPAE